MAPLLPVVDFLALLDDDKDELLLPLLELFTELFTDGTTESASPSPSGCCCCCCCCCCDFCEEFLSASDKDEDVFDDEDVTPFLTDERPEEGITEAAD